MRGQPLCLAAIGSAVLAWSASASAVTCYIVLDRNDNAIYRSTYPPIDMSDQGAPARERMRQRGEYLMFVDLEICPGVTYFTGAGGSKGLALDEVVNGMPALSVGGGVSQTRGRDSNPASAPESRAPAPQPTTSPPAPSGAAKPY